MVERNRSRVGFAVPAAVLMLWAAPVAAQDPVQSSASELDSARERPWAKDVSAEDQEAAYKLFREGNVLLRESAFVPAIEKYHQALERWDHPAIHYNLALALPSVDPIEGYQQMTAAIRYGPEPLGKERFEYASIYVTQIEKLSTRVEITCEEPGASVTMDGKLLFVAPGRFEGLVRPGLHSIGAIKNGYLPATKSPNLLPGERVSIALKPDPIDHNRTRWPVWQPWAVLGAGATAVLSGVVVHTQAGRSYRTFDDKIQARCPVGCVPEASVAQWRARGDSLQGVAYGTYVLGGAALATGVVLVYLNQPGAYPNASAQGEERVAVAPWLGGGVSGAVATFRF